MRIEKQLTIWEDFEGRTKAVKIKGLSEKTVDKLQRIIHVYTDGSFTAHTTYKVWLLGGSIDTPFGMEIEDIRNDLTHLLESMNKLKT